MIFKTLVLFIFCVTYTVCRSTLDKPLRKEKSIDLEESHFANHPPLEGKEIPVQVVYDEVTVASSKPYQEIRSRGNIRYGTKTNKVSEKNIPENKITTFPSPSATQISTTMKSITTTMTTETLPIEMKTVEKNNNKATEAGTENVSNNEAHNKIYKNKLAPLPSRSATRLPTTIVTSTTSTASPIEVKTTEINSNKSMNTEKNKPNNKVLIIKSPAEIDVQEKKLNTLPGQSPTTESSTIRKVTLTTAVPTEVKTTESNIIISTKTVTEKQRKKTKNVDLQIPVSIVIDDVVHKVKSRAEQDEQKPDVKTTIEKKIMKSSEETNEESISVKKEDEKIVTNKPEKKSTNSTTNQIENSTRQSKYIRQRDPIIPIIESDNQIYSQSGKFNYSYEGGDGTKSYQSGILKEVDKDHMGEAVVGGFSYKDKDGNDFMISYTADENGYQPVGAHLPTPPPVPPAIARALLYLATKTTPEPVTKSTQEMN